MHLESKKTTIPHSKAAAFDFLDKPENLEKIMPADLDKFCVNDESTISFSLKGMPEITLKKKESIPNTQVIYGAPEGTFKFTLVAHIDEVSDHESEIHWEFNGDFNAMMGMMIKNPITNFMQSLSTNMAHI